MSVDDAAGARFGLGLFARVPEEGRGRRRKKRKRRRVGRKKNKREESTDWDKDSLKTVSVDRTKEEGGKRSEGSWGITI